MNLTIKASVVPFAQGTPEWAAHRLRSLNASELAAAMGMSSYMTRSELVAMNATGITPEIDDATQRRFDMGHEFEATARQWAEEIIGDDLYSNVFAADVEGLDRPLSVSLDGHTMAKDVIWEHKTANSKLIESLESGVIPDQYHPQIEQCLMLTGAVKCLFMASAGSRNSMRYAWYESNSDLRARIIPTWMQLEQSVADFVPQAPTIKVEAEVVEHLPAVSVRMDGKIFVSSNLDVLEKKLRAFVAGLNKEPETDQDFANCEAAVKSLDKAEAALSAARASAIAQVASVETMTTAVDTLLELSRTNRLAMTKIVAARKESIKTETVTNAQQALADHIMALNLRIGRPLMPRIAADFAGAIKGKKSVDTLKEAARNELVRAKTEATVMAERIIANLATINATALPQLFADLATLVVRDPADVAMLAEARVTTHKAAEQKRLEDERSRLKKEMLESEIDGIEQQLQIAAIGRAGVRNGGTIECIRETLAETEAWPVTQEKFGDLTAVAASTKDRVVGAIRSMLAKKEAAAAAAAAAATAAAATEQQQIPMGQTETAAIVAAPAPAQAPAPALPPVSRPAVTYPSGGIGRVTPAANDQPEEVEDDGSRIKLGDLNTLLAPLSITADGLATLGFKPVTVDKNAKLYRECDIPAICQSIVRHVNQCMTEHLLAA